MSRTQPCAGTSTPLWKRYLPQATDWSGALPSAWVVPASCGTFYPLVRSRRGDGRDVSPQVYIARKEGRTAVISSADLWTKGGPEWALGPQTTVALVRIALDLHSGALKLTDADKIDLPADLPADLPVDLPADLPAAEPLTTRVPTGQVDSDGAPVVTRWGKFDGSGLELSDTTPLPRVLKAGSAVTLPLTSNGRPLWLRVRGAVAESGAVLKVAAGKNVLWNESLSYLDVGKVGNFGNTDLSGVPLEFNRRVFLPPTAERVLTLSNPGAKPLYFDAVQLENAPVIAVPLVLRVPLAGMGAWKASIDGSASQSRHVSGPDLGRDRLHPAETERTAGDTLTGSHRPACPSSSRLAPVFTPIHRRFVTQF